MKEEESLEDNIDKDIVKKIIQGHINTLTKIQDDIDKENQKKIKHHFVLSFGEIGNLAEILDLMEEAKEAYEKSFDCDPKDPLAQDSLFFLVDVQLNKELYKKAEETIEKISKNLDDLSEFDKLSYFEKLSFIKQQVSEFEGAKEAAEKAINISSNSTRGWENLALSELELENYDKAEEAAEKCVESDRLNVFGWYILERARSNLGKQKECYKAELNLARTESVKGRISDCIETIERLFTFTKYNENLCGKLKKLSDFENVRKTSKFDEILKEYCDGKNHEETSLTDFSDKEDDEESKDLESLLEF